MWSEWYALFDDGRDGWLAEAQGFYMMSLEAQHEEAPPAAQVSVEDVYELNGEKFTVDDIRLVTYAGSEGELPFVYQHHFNAKSVDLRGPSKKFASILYGPEETTVFLGRYQDFDEFGFDYLREIDGWRRA